MNNFFNLSKILITAIFLFITCNSFSQDKKGPTFTTAIMVERGEEKSLDSAVAKLYKQGNLTSTFITKVDGIITFNLDPNSDYLIEISKPGYVSKKLTINTKVPDYETQNFEVAMSVLLFVPCEGLDYSVLQNPVAKISYNANRRNFFPDENYEDKMLSKLSQLLDNNQKCIDDKYNKIVKKADDQMNQKKYIEARDIYVQAKKIRPDDKYVKDKIDEIDRILANQKNNDKSYNDLISQADKHFNDKRYALAKELYKRALTIKPASEYPTSQIALIDKLLAKQNQETKEKQTQDTKFQSLIDQGDAALENDICGKAVQSYRDALNINPNDIAVQKKLADANAKCKDLQAKTSQDKEKQKQYNKAISKADSLFKTSNYVAAKSAYQEAQKISPTTDYPSQKVKEIENLQKAKDKDQETKFQNLVAQGDDAMDNDICGKALTSYKEALKIKPNDLVLQKKVNNADAKCKDIQAKATQDKDKQDQFKKAIADADAALKKNDFDAAKTAYEKALQILPSESYPKQKLSEIEGVKKEQANKTDKDYNAKIQSADRNFASKNYAQAKQDYQDALKLKSTQDYPTQRLNDVNKIIADQEKTAADSKAKLDAYNAAIAKADNLLKNQQYDQALLAYNEASAYKPDEQYPFAKKDEITKIKKQQELETNYKKTISDADSYYNQKNYELAKTNYSKALSLKKDDPYATSQVAKTDKAISDRLKSLSDAKAKQDAYDKSIADADKANAMKDFATAKTNYQTAMAIFPDKAYAKQKIDEIDKIQKEQKQNEDYREAIDEANDLFNKKQYDLAKAKYKSASLLKPEDSFPSEKIKDIDKIVSQNEADKQKQAQNEKSYNDAIARGNELFDKAQYDAAKKEYEQASSLMPGENYPKQRIYKINEIKSSLAKAEKKQSTEKQVAKQQTVNPDTKISDLNFKTTTERELYLKDLLTKYPAGVTCEIYKEKARIVTRYIVVRENQANDYREIKYNWGGLDYLRNDKPITQLYFNSQVNTRKGEYYSKTEM